MKAFADPRYVRVGKRPMFLIYRPGDLPNARKTTDVFRNECIRHGVPEPYLIGINSYTRGDQRKQGFDCTMDFEPLLGVLPGPMDDGIKIYDYTIARQRMVNRHRDYPHYPCVVVSWDNTPRRGEEGIVFINSTPQAFEAGLRAAVDSTLTKPFDDRLVFLNAWNEWAEGNHLEPDLKHGLGYLEAVRRVNVLAEPKRAEV